LLAISTREPLRREATQKLKQIDIRDAKHRDEMFVTHDWLAGPIPKLKPTYAAVSENYIAKEKRIGDPTRLILVDEADRLKIVCLEQMRAIFDAGGIGLVLIGMPGSRSEWRAMHSSTLVSDLCTNFAHSTFQKCGGS
jgi:hypothetical protein